ncbi:MAG: UvrD-helicase domain-containing protein [Holosporales bacterium]|jgi:DNA helicase-2/ATP-dependent DNA helicase PcrA|nr:UvrD-helicase domain-containing protein [Holosporales bacterium]
MPFSGVLRVVSDDTDFLSELNPQQREAVLTVDGPLLVLAGAGTGKTRVLTSRIAHIISQGLAFPDEILAVTFTNKAAFEMKQRVCELVQDLPGDMWIGTIHSMAMRILRQYGGAVGLDPNFSILDDDDQLRLVKGIVSVLELDEKQYQTKVIMGHIRRWKDRGLFPWKLGLAMGPIETMSRRIYKEYQERLKTLRALDFGDLLLYCTKLFDEHPEVLQIFHEKFKYILVDEYQDTNTAQYLWLKALASGRKNICCVGDDDQAIYTWRGADVGNILRFEQDFEGAKVIRLEQNYRSSGHILTAASALIRNNVKRLGKELWTSAREGDQIRVKHAWNSEDEARFICNEIEKLRAEGASFGSMAVLVRAIFQTREFEERFLRQNVPYQVVGGLRFYERQEIRDAIAYIKFLIDNDDSLAFERIINVPKRSIGEATLHKAHVIAQEEGVSVPVAAQMYAAKVRGKASQAINVFFSVITEARALLDNTPPAIVVKTLLEDSGYISMWKQEKTSEALTRLENLKELVNAIAEFDSLRDFVDHVSLMADRVDPDNPDIVSMMTIHGAKGLEFDTVFLVGWEENLFPNQRTIVDNGMSGLEEERRLAYVGITRAKKLIFISYCSHRKTNNSGWQMAVPSRFIRELPRDSVIFLDKKGIPGPTESMKDVADEETSEMVRARYKSM